VHFDDIIFIYNGCSENPGAKHGCAVLNEYMLNSSYRLGMDTNLNHKVRHAFSSTRSFWYACGPTETTGKSSDRRISMVSTGNSGTKS
jgi:hypothetical protein